MKLAKSYCFIFLTLIQNTFGTTFYAHPERNFEQTQQLKATFLLTESLHRIAMAFDSAGTQNRKKIIENLIDDKSITTVLGIGDLSQEEKYSKVRSALSIWPHSYPGSIIDIGDFQKASVSSLGLLQLTFNTTRMAYKVAGLEEPKNVDEVIDNMTFGPHDVYQDNKILDLRSTMKGVCNAKKIALDENINAPKEYHWMRWVIKLAPSSVTQMAEMFLGYKKNCETLSSDVMDITNPHFSPLRGNPKAKGQTEGLSVFLVKKVYANNKNIENSPIIRALRALRRTSELSANESEEDAVIHALDVEIKNADLVNLFGLATHNHGLEIYLMKGALELINDQKRAVNLALEMDANINHFYGLLAKHHKARLEIAKNSSPTSLRIKAERPYHYWGGAVVSCELVNRGYETWVASLSSAILGKAYEMMITGSNGESIANKSEDINLHLEGAQTWARFCR